MRIAAGGFRECDARWRYPQEIDLAGAAALGRGLGTQLRETGAQPEIVVGRDHRSYAPAVCGALVEGLVSAGIVVHDIGLALTPTAYFARDHLRVAAVAMVTASHNPNGWTGVKMGFVPPLTHGPDEMAQLADIVLGGHGRARPGGAVHTHDLRAAYLDELAAGPRLTRPLRVVCATGNGTAGAFAPDLLARLGLEVIPRHTTLDATFPHYDPDPESPAMQRDIGDAVRESGADLGFGFDGDGDRCGVVDASGRPIFADRLGVLLARDLAQRHPGARFIADVKSTALFATDPVLAAAGARTEYWKTGHSHMKRRLAETGALAGFERSGHVFLAPPVGRGYDCALRTAVEVCRLLDRAPGTSLAALAAKLPSRFATPTLSPTCPDAEKYGVTDRLAARLRALAAGGGRLGGHEITGLLEINGIRATLAHGGWVLVRASSNTPNLVVVCESPRTAADLAAIVADMADILRTEPAVAPLAWPQSTLEPPTPPP